MCTILAFTADQIHRLTGLSRRQIRYWATTGFFSPSQADQPRRPYGRVYSFQDLVWLRTIALLNRVHGVPLQRLRKVKEWLDQHPYETWGTLRFYLAGQDLIFEDRELQVFLSSRDLHQTLMAIDMKRIIREAEIDAAELTHRDPDEIGRITQHRHISHNQPVIAGTRVRAEAVWKFHQAGYSTDAIIEQYPRLTQEDVEAAIEFVDKRRHKLAG